MRLFKLTRIKNLSVTDEVFSERDLMAAGPDGNPARHQRPLKEDVTLKLRIEPEMAYRVYDEFDEEDAVKQPDGGFIVTVTWPEDEWVYGGILSYGECIEVLEPEHIREIIQSKARRMAEKYGQTGRI
jgi:predicted DNA-binding transcriptional regulator YafY